MSRLDYRAWLLAGAVLPLAAFAVPAAHASTETVVYSFCSQQSCTDGKNPGGGLIQAGDELYGTTEYGGTGCYGYGCGTLYAINLKTGAETVLHAFAGGTDVEGPQGNLVNFKGTLYGTSWDGGTAEYDGTVFAVNRKTGAESVVYSFQGASDGANPAVGLLKAGGELYGTTFAGGLDNNGTVFSLDPQTGAETAYSFGNGTYGVQSAASLILVKGKLYGTTTNGDTDHDGTVFSFDRKTGAIATSYAFQGEPDAARAEAGLVDVNGTLYGTTVVGGAYNSGSVFLINPKTGEESVVYSFPSDGSQGTCPQAGLTNVNGTLYGTTDCGGAYGYGTAFSFNLQTGTEALLYSFGGGTDGQYPTSLTNVDGVLYGTTQFGGANGDGVVFSITP